MAKSKGKRGKRGNIKARARLTSPDMILEFFELPPELRNMVYDELWKMNNRIAAYHTQSQTGILAYYDGTVLDESDLTTREAWSAARYQKPLWRPGQHACLPIWLLTSKRFVDEAIDVFRKQAHWNLWPIGSIDVRNHRLDPPDTMIMSPKFANSISFARLPFERPVHTFSIIHRYDGTIHVSFARDEKEWLQSLVNHVENAPQTQSLKIALAFPSIGFRRDEMQYHEVEFRVKVHFPYSQFIRVCTKLQTLEIELFHLDDFAGEVLDIELLDQVRAQVKALLGNDFTEVVTPTPTTAHGGYFHGRQLFDHLLVYSKT